MRGGIEWTGPSLSDTDLLQALTPVLESFAQLGVRHFVGGSIASSAHGVSRASIDADVVAELSLRHVEPLIASLQSACYIPEEREGRGNGPG